MAIENDYSFATPVETEDYSFATPVKQTKYKSGRPVPATPAESMPEGMSVSGAGGEDYQPAPKAPGTMDKLNAWSDKQNRATERRLNLGIIGLTEPVQAGLQMASKIPGLSSLAKYPKELQAYKKELLAGNPSTAGMRSDTAYEPPTGGSLAHFAGEMIPQTIAAEGLAATKLAGLAGKGLSKIIPTVGKYATLAKKGAIAGAGFGATSSAMTPVEEGIEGPTEDFWSKKGTQIATGAGIGAALGGTLSAAIPALAATPKKLREMLSGYKGKLPKEITSGEDIATVLKDAIPAKLQGNVMKAENPTPLKDLQRIASSNSPEAPAALQRIQRANVATANELGVPMSVGDITQDVHVMAKEAALEKAYGSKVAKFRAEQGKAINTAINDLPEGRFNPRDIVLQAEDDLGAPLLNTLQADKSEKARQLVEQIESAKTNEQVIQASLAGKGHENRIHSGLLYNEAEQALDKGIKEALKINPTFPTGVDLTPASNHIDRVLTMESAELASNPALRSSLAELRSLPNNAPYRQVKNLVSKLEEDAGKMAASGDRKAAAALGSISKTLDESADAFASKLLPKDETGLTIADIASNFYKENVVPYNNRSSRIAKIINGEQADIATKRLFAIDSPEEFKTVFNALDARGKQAVKAEILSRANEASKNGSDLQAWAKFMDKHEEQVATAFRESADTYSKPELISHLISQTPRAGIGGKTAIESALSSGHMLKLGAGALGFSTHGLAGSLGYMAAETAAEAGLSRLAGKAMAIPTKTVPLGKLAQRAAESGIPIPQKVTLDQKALEKLVPQHKDLPEWLKNDERLRQVLIQSLNSRNE